MSRSQFSSALKTHTEPDIDRLAMRISMLACHRAFDRNEVLSPQLKKYLPYRRQSDRAVQQREARSRLIKYRPTENLIDYLAYNIAIELDLASSRLATA